MRAVPSVPTATIAIPTRKRPNYLEVTLASVAPQAREAGAEVLVVSDGPDGMAAEIARRHDVRLVPLTEPSGLNAARNAAVKAAASELIVFVDDDVDAPSEWLDQLLAGVRESPEHDVFGGPIRARLEGGGPRACGRESAPITTLDHGSTDCDVPFVWGANMAVRRCTFERIGGFDEAISDRGDEEEWERRYIAAGGRVRYLARAGLDHRRTEADSTVFALAKASYRLGRSARRNDVRNRIAPPIAGELRTLAGCVWHIFRRRCAIGIVLVAQSAGRVREALRERWR
jgi:GT2 family glycosyltransferase